MKKRVKSQKWRMRDKIKFVVKDSFLKASILFDTAKANLAKTLKSWSPWRAFKAWKKRRKNKTQRIQAAGTATQTMEQEIGSIQGLRSFNDDAQLSDAEKKSLITASLAKAYQPYANKGKVRLPGEQMLLRNIKAVASKWGIKLTDIRQLTKRQSNELAYFKEHGEYPKGDSRLAKIKTNLQTALAHGRDDTRARFTTALGNINTKYAKTAEGQLTKLSQDFALRDSSAYSTYKESIKLSSANTQITEPLKQPAQHNLEPHRSP